MRVPNWRCHCNISYEHSILKILGVFTMLFEVPISLSIASTGIYFSNFGFNRLGMIRKIRKQRKSPHFFPWISRYGMSQCFRFQIVSLCQTPASYSSPVFHDSPKPKEVKDGIRMEGFRPDVRLLVSLNPMTDASQLQPILSHRSPRCPPLTQRRRTTEGRETRRDGTEVRKMGGGSSLDH